MIRPHHILLLACPALAALAAPALAQDAALGAERLKAAFPAAWDGYERSEPEFEAPMAGLGGFGQASANYRDQRGGTNYFEAVLRISDMGLSGGRMYADYGADYLKGPVENETQKSVTVGGQPGLLTLGGDDYVLVETYFAPRLLVSASCMKATTEECVAAIERFDFAALKALAETTP